MATHLNSLADRLVLHAPRGLGAGASVRAQRTTDADRGVLGVLGGMGPKATADFYRRLVERTPAAVDQEHLPVVIWADPRVPDRTAALVEHGPSPLPALVEGARRLRRAGVTVIAVPCNTAHAFVRSVSKAAGVEVLDMVGAALARASGQAAPGSGIGILATRGTRATGLYEHAATVIGRQVVQVPEEIQRDCVDAAIREVKASGDLMRAEALIAVATRTLRALGAGVVIAACTEIPLLSTSARDVLPVVDSTEELVELALVRLGRLPGLAV